ncbi:MAG: bifunctional biotin--[acetyl-CoA-carboxylase] ligase/biotin operon repressor BirA [Pseudomonadota bacterium]
MAETLYALVAMLADGRFHSGEDLGKSLGIGRAAVWKSLQQLSPLGLELHAVSGRGYRLATPVELLSESRISVLLDDNCRNGLSGLQIFHSIDSTSKYLKQAAESGAPSGTVCLAEHQSEGRGRRGRHWHSPYASNLYLSVVWRFNDGMSRLSGLSLAVAVAMMRCFDELGASGTGIKWPNDIISEQGKLAGILLDVAGESSGPCYAVIGIGVNYDMSTTVGGVIDQAWTQLRDCGVTLGRNEVVASLLNNLFKALMLYEQEGFEAFRGEWQQWDMLRDHEVRLQMANETRDGIARGIDESGLLLVEQQGKLYHYAAGEVSLRKAGS